MTTKNIIDPINRIEGDLAIEIEIDDDNIIKDAKSMGFVYRGFENIFIGRKPFDAMRLSQRSCGVCPVSHGSAGAYAIESINNFKIPRNAEIIRDVVLGTNIIVSHATHFYFMWGPDLVDESYKESELYPLLLEKFDPLKSPHLKNILKEARIPLHKIVAIFGGKFPHPAHAVPGGVTCVPKQIELNKVISILTSVKLFLEKEVLNGIPVEELLKIQTVTEVLELMKNKQFADSDIGIYIKAATGLGLDKLGEQTVDRFISFGFGKNKDGNHLFKSGYVEHGKLHELNSSHISEDTSHSYYETEEKWRNPKEGITIPKPHKEGAYSWIKAARYLGHPVEAGPLARQIVNNNPLIKDLIKTFGVNTFTRNFARVYECFLILPKLIEWVDEIDLNKPFHYPYKEVDGEGFGLVEAPRGALGHWISVKNGVVKRYQIITPTVWNGSPTDSKGQKSPIEKALIGVKLKTKNSIIEAGHIVRGFDPCISCSIHTLGKNNKRLIIEHTN